MNRTRRVIYIAVKSQCCVRGGHVDAVGVNEGSIRQFCENHDLGPDGGDCYIITGGYRSLKRFYKEILKKAQAECFPQSWYDQQEAENILDAIECA